MNENVYFECRKRAAIHNERLNSRAGAAEILGISESTLAHYELGITKNIPVDIMDEDILAKKMAAVTDMSMCDIPCRMTAPNLEVKKMEQARKDACFI